MGPPGASQEAEEELASRLEGVLGNARGYLPNGTQLISVPVESRGINPFRTYLKSLDESLVLAATGGKLSVLAEPGVGQQAGLVHWQAWGEILQGEAQILSEILQRQFDTDILRQHFPGRPVQAWFQLCTPQETEVSTVVQHVAQLAAAGYRMEPSQLSERIGYTLREG